MYQGPSRQPPPGGYRQNSGYPPPGGSPAPGGNTRSGYASGGYRQGGYPRQGGYGPRGGRAGRPAGGYRQEGPAAGAAYGNYGGYGGGRDPHGMSRGQIIAIAVCCAAALAILTVIVVLVVLSSNQKKVQRHLQLGERFLNEMDYDSAVLEFSNAIEVDPRSELAYLGRGEAYAAQGEYELAEQDYTTVIEELNPESIPAYVGRAEVYEASGDSERAEDDRQQAITIYEESKDEPADTPDAPDNPGGGASDPSRPQDGAAALPLTARDLAWVLEPSYAYQQVLPIRGSSFSDIMGPFSEGVSAVNGYFFEMSYPGYSNLPEYYLVQAEDGSWRVYSMTEHIDSGDLPVDGPLDTLRLDADGITNYAAYNAGYDLWGMEYPWNVFTVPDRIINSMGILYDPAGNQSVMIGGLADLTVELVAEANLHKPYPAELVDLSSTGLDVSFQNNLESGAWDSALLDLFNLLTYNYPKGYVDTDGAALTDFIYDEAEDFSDGLAACCLDGKWGYLDETGAQVTDFVYDGVWPYTGDFDLAQLEYETQYAAYPCTDDTMVVWRDGQVGLLYRDGAVLIEFGQFEDMAPSYNNELWVRQDGLWGLVDLADAKRQAGLPVDSLDPANGTVGDWLSSMFFDFTVNSARTVEEYDGYTAAEGNKLVVCSLTLYNTFGDDLPMYDTDFQLAWGDGEDEYAWSLDPLRTSWFGRPANDQMPLQWYLRRGGEATYDLVFEVPADITDFQLVYLEEYYDLIYGVDGVGDLFCVHFTA